MLMDMSIPNLELLGIIGVLGVASVAAWSSAALNMRMRMMERDIDDLYDEVRAARAEQAVRQQFGQQFHSAPQHTPVPLTAGAVAPGSTVRPTRRSAAAHVSQPTTLPPLSHQFAGDSHEKAGAHVRPNVALLAEQLAEQSREQMDKVLTPALDLGASQSTVGAGRQESRLLRWMNGVTGQFSTQRQ
jgi:hypothetical protein